MKPSKIQTHRQIFQNMVANGQLEVPIGTVLLEFEVADSMLRLYHYEKSTKPPH